MFKYIFANCMRGQRRLGVENPSVYIKKILEKQTCVTHADYISVPKYNFKNLLGYSKLMGHVYDTIKKGKLPLTIGGDHSISIGTLSGALEYYGDTLSTIWIDAHADINTMESSLSGNLHGMPLSYVSGLQENFLNIHNKLDLDNLIYFGIRDLDEFEENLIKNKNIKNLTSAELNLNKQIDFHVNTENIHLSIDVDVLDPKYMKSTGTPVDNGIDLNKLQEILDWTVNQGNIVSIDLVEYNPYCSKDDEEQLTSLRTYERIFDMLHKL
jgi:arginase